MGTQRSQLSEQCWLKSEAREGVWRQAELTAERVVHRRDQEDHHRDEHRDQPGDHQVRAQFSAALEREFAEPVGPVVHNDQVNAA
jgi:hypothetical protein